MPIKPENRERYPKEWKNISLRIRQDRAKWRCECRGECGVKHQGRCMSRNGHRLVSGRPACVVLTVAHLDHDPSNCADSNLLAMCQACHLKYDAEQHRKHAAETSEQKKRDAGQQGLFDD